MILHSVVVSMLFRVTNNRIIVYHSETIAHKREGKIKDDDDMLLFFLVSIHRPLAASWRPFSTRTRAAERAQKGRSCWRHEKDILLLFYYYTERDE